MKTKLILLLLTCWVGVVWGQKVNLTNNSITKISYLKDIKSQNDFYQRIINADKDAETYNILKKNGINQPLHIKKQDIMIVNLEYQADYYSLNHLVVNINKENEIAYEIKVTSKSSLYFYPKGQFFLVKKTTLSTEKNIALPLIQQKIGSIGYDCNENKAIHEDVLSKNLTAIKKVVIFNSQDDATSNSALAFTNGSNDTKLSIGANFNYGNQLFFNVGINTLAANSGLFYSKKAWKNDIGASFTVNRVMWKETQYFMPEECEKLARKRKSLIDSLQYDIKLMNAAYPQLEERVVELQTSIDKKLSRQKLSYEEVATIKKEQKEIAEIQKQLVEYKKSVNEPEQYIEDKLIAFDTKNDILYGSKLYWLKGTVNINNQNLDIDSLSTLIGDKITNIPKLSFNLSYNLQKQSEKRLLNVQAFSNIIMGSFLDANIGTDKPYLVNENNETYVFDSTGTQIGQYNKLKRAFWTLQSGSQATWFFYKSFGVSGFASHSFALQNLEGTDYRNRYTLLGGLIFKINNEEDVNKATFRILCGVENEPYKTKALDNFMVKLSLGIPFNFKNKKS